MNTMDNESPSTRLIVEKLGKLYRETKSLSAEVAKLTSLMSDFENKAKTEKYNFEVLPPRAGGNDRSLYKTEETQSVISATLYEFSKLEDLTIPTRTIIAIARDLDGALRDIRAARLNFEAISKDPDWREDFRAWQRGEFDE